MPPVFIPDGYTEDATIPAQPGHFDQPIKIEWRPLTWEERGRYFKSVSPDDVTEQTTKLLVERLLSWDVKSGQNLVEITTDNVKRLEHFAYEAITAKILDIKIKTENDNQKN